MQNTKQGTPASPERTKTPGTGGLRSGIRQYTMVIALLLVWGIFTIFTGAKFIEPRNLSNLFLQSATVAIIAVGMVWVMVAGHIDLSVGSLMGFCGAIVAVLITNLNWNPIFAILATLVVGILIGIWQGYWIAYRGVPAFIVTLAGMLIYRGGVLGVASKTISPNSPSFAAIGQGYLPALFGSTPGFNGLSAIVAAAAIILYNIYALRSRASRIKYGFSVPPWLRQILIQLVYSIAIGLIFGIMVFYMGIPYAILIIMILVLVFSFVSSNTSFGRYIYAIGGNREAARLSGINVAKTNMYIFIVMGFLSAVAGVVFTARLNAATLGAGTSMELDVIAAAVIGGTSTLGGEGTVFGAIIGALVMSSLDNGMSLMNLDVTWQYVVKGLVLLLAVAFDVYSRKRA
jgi:D-xylose transport system permease protein